MIDQPPPGVEAGTEPECPVRAGDVPAGDVGAGVVGAGVVGGGVDGVLTAAAVFADALAALSPGDLPDASLSDLLVALDVHLNRIDASHTSLVGVWDARSVWALEAARSGASWLASHTEQSRVAASGQIRLARSLRGLPVCEAACRSGELGQAKARLLASAAAEAPELFSEHESMLVTQAIGLRVDQVAKMVEFWKAHANPEGAAEQQARQHAARGVQLSETFGGMWVLNGQLTSEQGEVLRGELDRRAKARYRAEKSLADANGTTVETTARQRRADALIEMALQAVAAGDDGTAINVAAITALIRVDQLADPDVKPEDVVGETDNGSPLRAASALRLSCDCSISRVVLGPNSVPVDLGMTARLPSPAQRRALAARDRGCVFPGCDRHAGWTSAHHLVHWIHDGPTNLQNLVLLCVYHHHQVHEGGFGIQRAPSGALEFTKPDGTHLQVPKGRSPDPTWPHAA